MEGLSPQEALENKELRQILDRAIAKLPRKYRMVLVLRDMEGLSAKEVGSILRTERARHQVPATPRPLVCPEELSGNGLTAEGHEGITTRH